MALAKRAIAFLMIMALLGASIGAVYNVGDADGWTSIGNVDYDNWAASKNFHVGDTLVFKYNNQFHNVKQVTHQDFQSCNTTSPIALYNNGSDTITLDRPGHFYFLCGFPSHCQAGQKVHVEVTRASASSVSFPSPATSPTQNSAPTFQSSKLLSALVVLSFFVTGYAY